MTPFSVLVLLAIPAVSYAQDTPKSGPKSFGELVVSLLPYAISLMFFALTTYVAPALRKWLTEKAALSGIARVALKIETLAESVVALLNAGMKTKFEEAAADGKITAEEAKALGDEALRLVKEFLGQEGLLSITGVLGLATSLVDTFLRGQIEKAVEKANTVEAVKLEARAVTESGVLPLQAT